MTIQETRARARRERVQAMAREDILEAALRCFAQSGFAHTKIADIAAAAGYTAASLYTYYPGKKEIFAAAAEHFINRIEAAFGPVPEAPAESFESFASEIRTRVRSLCAYGDAHSEVLAFFMRLKWTGDALLAELPMGPSTECVATYGGRGAHRLPQHIAEVWQRLGAGAFGVDPIILSGIVIGTIEAFFVRKYLLGAGGTMSEDADQIADLLLYGVRGNR